MSALVITQNFRIAIVSSAEGAISEIHSASIPNKAGFNFEMMTTTENATIQIRPARIADAVMLAELARRTFFDAFVGICSPENMELYLADSFTPEVLAKELSDPHSVFLIAEIEGVPAGYAKLCAGEIPDCVTGKNPLEIVRLYAEQKFLGQGIGPALMARSLDRARQLRHDTIFLGVWEHNYRAQSFYRKWGFEKTGQHVFMMGSDPQTDWWMQRGL